MPGRTLWCYALVVLALSACSAAPSASTRPGIGALPALPSLSVPARSHASPSPIQHVVIVIQENRSFDNFFAGYPGADGSLYGYTHTGKRIPLTKVSLLDDVVDLDHNFDLFQIERDGGKMDGFDQSFFAGTYQPAGLYPYQYVNPQDISEYWRIAHRYVLADRMFQSEGGSSFTSHQYLIAGTTAINSTTSIVNTPSAEPWGCDAPPGTKTSILESNGYYGNDKGPFPCFAYKSLRDVLDAGKVSWRYYAPSFSTPGGAGQYWTAFDAIRAVRYDRAEWPSRFSSPETNVLLDAAAGRLANVSWVVPDYGNSDHPGIASDTGPSWVASIVNAVGKGPQWKSTAIIVVWDDWGGMYDHVAPPQLDYVGLGFRVPCLIVSPYAKRGYVDHTQYEFGSILKFVENNWGLGNLGATDVRANDMLNAFNLTHGPRKFTPIPAKYSLDHFLHERHSKLPPDDD